MDGMRDPQDETLQFLGDPATHGGTQPVRIDTHAAAVFLANDRALKMKRAVRFPFLDYSTLGLRRRACDAELEANRPFAPQLYRRVVAITREPDGRLALDGRGEPVEFAVEMKRFPQEALLDRMADAGLIDDALADALGRMVAAMQEHEPAAPAAPWIEALADYLGQNRTAFNEWPELFPGEAAALLDETCRTALERVTPLLRKRGGLGLVRRGHGDLHLGNIALVDGKPLAFDAIEFDPLIATGDVIYELSFLLMDLVERELTRAANIVLNRYLAETRRESDLEALAALPLFLSLRAALRAKVIAARAVKAQPGEQEPIRRSARRYFDIALRLIEPVPAKLVAVGGLSGTGKSVLARAIAADLAPAPGAIILRTDVERKILFGKNETERLPDEAYAPEVSAKVYAALNRKAARALTAGHSVVADAVFALPQERKAIADIAKASGAGFCGLFLTADLGTRLARVGARAADASDADAEVVRKQDSHDPGPLDWSPVDANDAPGDTLARARAALG